MTTTPLVVRASPHLRGPDSTSRIMWNVVGSLAPIVAVATYFFGPSALLGIGASVAGALVPERLFGRGRTLHDGSAAVTGVLLGMTLPPGFPLWMAFVGGFFAIAIGKLVFGGLGQNVFNPALLGRAFLQASFPVAITTFPDRSARPSWGALCGDLFAWPLMSPQADAATGATPLGLMKFEATGTRLLDLLRGSTSGSIGETAGLLILVCGLYLAMRGYLNWRIPVSVMATVAAFAAVLHAIDADRFPGPMFMLFSGGLMLGAWYMATDMVTSPVTNVGCWLFGVGVGALVVVIRVWGGLAEGVMYAILLMNALVPFIDRMTQPRVFGAVRVGRVS